VSEFHFRVRAKDAGGEGSTRRPVGGPYEVRERESSPGGSHAERLVMPSVRLIACVLAAQERFWGSSCSA
jgi:hypothetical protein